MAEGVPEVLERPATRKDGAIPIARKRDENDTEVSKDGKGGNRAKEQQAKGAHRRPGFARSALACGLGHHGVRVPAERPLAGCVTNNRRGEHDGDQGEGKGIASNVVNAGENLYRGYTGELEHQRHAQFRKCPDEAQPPIRVASGHRGKAFVGLLGFPESQQQHGELSGHSDQGPLLGLGGAVLSKP